MLRWLIILTLIYTAPSWTIWVRDTTETVVYTLKDTREAASRIRASLAL